MLKHRLQNSETTIKTFAGHVSEMVRACSLDQDAILREMGDFHKRVQCSTWELLSQFQEAMQTQVRKGVLCESIGVYW